MARLDALNGSVEKLWRVSSKGKLKDRPVLGRVNWVWGLGQFFMGKRLLLVEDEATLARALGRLLNRVGYEVSIAASCSEAQSSTGTFSIGVFDIDLPDGDGIDLAEHLR